MGPVERSSGPFAFLIARASSHGQRDSHCNQDNAENGHREVANQQLHDELARRRIGR